MGKSKKSAAQYEAGTLAAFAVIGILLIALGVLSLLSVVGGLQGAFFTQIKQVMYGVGGALCAGVSLLLIWGGVLVAFSSGRSMPKRGFLLIALLYLCVLAILNLNSKVGINSLMDYLVASNNASTPPLPNADGFGNMLRAAYTLCGRSGVFGGALGMLLAWPAWTFLGSVFGTVLLGVICLGCLLLISRFDFLQLAESVREGWRARSERRRQEEAQRAYEEQMEQQRLQAEEDDRRLLSPAFLRRSRKKEEQAQEEQPQPMVQPPVYPPYGSMLEQPPMPIAGMMGYPQQPAAQPEMYDEIIIPEGRQLPWRKNDKKSKKPAANAPFQTRMSFTPSEMGVPAEETQMSDTLIMPSAKKKALDRIEQIRKRKAELNSEIEGNNMAQAAVQAPPQDIYVPAAETDPVREEAPKAAAPDRHAAYKRPAKEADKPDFAPSASTVTEHIPYAYPSIDLLNAQQRRASIDTRAADTEDATRLEKTLESFGIPARVQRVTHGPAVTRFELGLVSSGINVKRIMGIADNIALDMAANGGVRIEIPIPGTNLFGVEVPNKEIQSVTLAEVLLSPEMQNAKSPLAVALGRDIAGKPVICDIAKMPHLLIAGQTGSGKSVCINAIINSILFRSSPDDVRMIMIDPKVVELQCYNVVPHLLIPVVSDPHKAAGALQWAVAEMLDRYHKMQSKNVREVSAYNAKLGPDEEKLPRIVIIIDELADLMLACKKEVEESIIRIAQLARAAGIHMVVATQRPTVDVITGLIKANIPSRIAFAVSSSIDSRTILDQNGAEKLLGRGDMFYFPTGASAPIRVQGCFLSDAETERVVGYIGQHSSVDFDPNVIEAVESEDQGAGPLGDTDESESVDDRLAEAIEMVITDGQASISMLQRRMKIGYARAGRLIDDMAARGIVSKSAGSKPREVLMSREEYERIKDTLL